MGDKHCEIQYASTFEFRIGEYGYGISNTCPCDDCHWRKKGTRVDDVENNDDVTCRGAARETTQEVTLRK
jgi:hypothetical protein